jgi:hypothetical protein
MGIRTLLLEEVVVQVITAECGLRLHDGRGHGCNVAVFVHESQGGAR